MLNVIQQFSYLDSMKYLLLSLLLFSFLLSYAQGLPTVEILSSGTKTSLRGLSVVNDNIVWCSGSNGTIGKSTDGGKDWKWLRVKGFEKRDFRDIQAFDATTAIIMSVDTPAYILKTVDGGESWKVVYENRKQGMFLDAMEFWNDQSGIVIGDPINGKFFVARSFDGGNTWQELPEKYKPVADSGEACFAASGTTVRALDRDEAVFVSGGLKSSIFIRDQKIQLPILQGKASTGAFSVAVNDHNKLKGGNNMIVVGGDYLKDTVTTMNCFYSTNRGKTWKPAQILPHGYRSCVEYISKSELVACGTSGIDFSSDDGNTWALISKESFNSCIKAKDGSAVYFVGGNGKVGKLVLHK